MIYYATAPLRISFAGGGTDVEPFLGRYGGEVVSATINLLARAELAKTDNGLFVISGCQRHREYAYDQMREHDGCFDFAKIIYRDYWCKYHGEGFAPHRGFRLELISPVSMRTGLGGSGAMCVAAIGAFNEAISHGPARDGGRNPWIIAKNAYQIEVESGNLTGMQDQYAAAFGGFNHFEFRPRAPALVNSIPIQSDSVEILEKGLILFSIGQRAEGAEQIMEEQAQRVDSGAAVDAMLEAKEIVPHMRQSLRLGVLQGVGAFLDAGWRIKKKYSSQISNPRIDALYDSLRSAGMLGGKVTGAGGGGHFIACCEPQDRKKLMLAAREHGAAEVPFRFTFDGLKTWQE